MPRPQPVTSSSLRPQITTDDNLVFDNEPSTTNDHMWQLRVEALTHLEPEDQAAIRTLIDGIPLRHPACKLAS